jgi:ATP-dependent DNA ligase
MARQARAHAALLPEFNAPDLAALFDNAPKGEGWLHEIKLDGYRTAAKIERGEVRVLTHDQQAQNRWSPRRDPQ